MAGFSETRTARKLIAMFAAITLLLIGVSICSVLYLNLTINRFSETLYQKIYRDTSLVLETERALSQSSRSLQTAYSASLPDSRKSESIQRFEEDLALVWQNVNAVNQSLETDKPYRENAESKELLQSINSRLHDMTNSVNLWQNDARRLILYGEASAGDFENDGVLSSDNRNLNEAHESLKEAAKLLGSYAELVTTDFSSHKSAIFAVYTLALFLLLLLILYLFRRIFSLQSEIREEQAMYRLIGETISDYILLTDQNGLILYASPSHFSALGYVPKKGEPLAAYIREPEIAWAKLRSVVQTAPRMAELRMRGADGHWVWMETKVTPVRSTPSVPAQFMLVSREITQRKQYEERLHKLAFYDHLTSIPNRAHFKMYMENLIGQDGPVKPKLALALLDCDRFKQLNDTLGHLAGDEFLQQLSGELQQTVKGLGQAFRIGGDEFAVVLHLNSAPENLNDILNRLLQLFNKSWAVDGSSFRTSASIGVSLYPEHGSTINQLLRAADLAMYRSKSHGGNEANLFNPDMDEGCPEQENSRY
ncbi:diguanylate cyclase [Paenibacillus sp. HN-1]|uniref:diguanylate cyclase domain-containing protein n=1 Tax=Paenibacillus TaxID=44249 RepID=UPI001CA99153|nr:MULTISPECIES: diguanylate cyclase [Paenibacillus]MBY9080521.1 diguanylate cyclase [Paenibacillus sp. CGMCC 1.18879]MBY9085534.1 diguanylate cyclase [Paenibacillus sinensis]